MVGVKGLEPSTSRSQTARATNCATPRKYGLTINIVSEKYQKYQALFPNLTLDFLFLFCYINLGMASSSNG